MMNTYINNLPGLAIFLTTYGYAYTRIHEKLCFTTGLSLALSLRQIIFFLAKTQENVCTVLGVG